MQTVLIGARPPVYARAFDWAERIVARVGHLWAENPWTLISFSVRLVRAWRCVLFDLSPRQLGHTVWRFIRQITRTFFRGVFVVLPLSIAIGFGVGVVARAAGPALQPIFSSVILTAILRDAVPLMLTLFLAGRMGGSIAARLGSGSGLGQGGPARVTDRELTELALPHLVAGTLTSAVFYGLGVYFIARGYLSQGQLERFPEAATGWYLNLRSTREAIGFGVLKSMVFGTMVAYIACAYGLRAGERALRGVRGVEEVQDAVWETSVTAIIIATAISVLMWLGVEAPLR